MLCEVVLKFFFQLLYRLYLASKMEKMESIMSNLLKMNIQDDI